VIIFETTLNLQRKLVIDTETKTIKRESKNIMWVWKIILLQNGCTNIISRNQMVIELLIILYLFILSNYEL